MAVKTILCDLDGVLIWHHPYDPSKDWRNKILSGEALDIWEEFQRSSNWQRCLRNHALNTRFHYLDYLTCHGHSLSGDVQSVIDIWLEHNSKACAPALKKLNQWRARGFECAIASNQDGARKPFIERWLSAHGLSDIPRFISCEIKMAKPDAGYFRHVEKALGRKPEELLLIDDQAGNIAGAQKAGWVGFLIDESYRLNPSKWDSVALFPMN